MVDFFVEDLESGSFTCLVDILANLDFCVVNFGLVDSEILFFSLLILVVGRGVDGVILDFIWELLTWDTKGNVAQGVTVDAMLAIVIWSSSCSLGGSDFSKYSFSIWSEIYIFLYIQYITLIKYCIYNMIITNIKTLILIITITSMMRINYGIVTFSSFFIVIIVTGLFNSIIATTINCKHIYRMYYL